MLTKDPCANLLVSGANGTIFHPAMVPEVALQAFRGLRTVRYHYGICGIEMELGRLYRAAQRPLAPPSSTARK